MALHLFRQDTLLKLISVLKELLDDIVSKNISHELKGVGADLRENCLLLVAIGSFQLLLNKPRAVLVSTEFNHMVVYILQFVAFVRF